MLLRYILLRHGNGCKRKAMRGMMVKWPNKPMYIFQMNRLLKSIPEFEKLPTVKMAFVCLVADYFSPIRRVEYDEEFNPYPDQEQRLRKQAAVEVGWVYERANSALTIKKQGKSAVNGDDLLVEQAIIAYRRLQQYDSIDMLMTAKATYHDLVSTDPKTDKAKMDKIGMIVKLIKEDWLKQVDDQIAEYFGKIGKMYDVINIDESEAAIDMTITDSEELQLELTTIQKLENAVENLEHSNAELLARIEMMKEGSIVDNEVEDLEVVVPEEDSTAKKSYEDKMKEINDALNPDHA
jgi:hypothetical protein